MKRSMELYLGSGDVYYENKGWLEEREEVDTLK